MDTDTGRVSRDERGLTNRELAELIEQAGWWTAKSSAHQYILQRDQPRLYAEMEARICQHGYLGRWRYWKTDKRYVILGAYRYWLTWTYAGVLILNRAPLMLDEVEWGKQGKPPDLCEIAPDGTWEVGREALGDPDGPAQIELFST